MSNQWDDRVRKSVIALRRAEHKANNLPVNTHYFLPWDADELRLVWRDDSRTWPLEIAEGVTVIVSGDPGYIDPDGRCVVDHGDLLFLQFFGEEDCRTFVKIRSQFRAQIRSVGAISKHDEAINPLVEYCNKVDAAISHEAVELAKEGVPQIFDRMEKELGGSKIQKDDRLGQRVRYFKNVVERYRKDKDVWFFEMRRLGLKVKQ